MAMTTIQKAAAWAAIQVLFAGCSGGTADTNKSGGTSDPSQVTTPSITTEPTTTTASAAGSSVTLSVQASGGDLFYQWKKNGANIGGATSSTYTTPALTAADDGAVYTVVVFNSSGNVTSSATTISVKAATPPPPAPVAPVISTGPADQSVVTGGTATFSVAATGSGLSYVWKKGSSVIAGATSASYTTPAATYTDSGAVYTVVVTGTGGLTATASATLTLALSADQQVLESVALAPAAGIYEANWTLNYVGPQNTGTDYLYVDHAAAAQSPLTHGPQFTSESAFQNLTSGLALPTPDVDRVLKNGAILLVTQSQNAFDISYVGSAVEVDDLVDGSTGVNGTVAYSQIRTGYKFVSLAGLLHAAPTELQQPFNSIFANADILDTTTNWAAGAGYITYIATNNGDRYNVGDCTVNAPTVPTGVNPVACQTGTTLEVALTAGEHSVSDGNITYHLTDGAIITVGGVRIWVATAQRPVSAVGSTTPEYRIYFEMNGNIYTGNKIYDKAPIGGGHYRTNPADASTAVYLPYQVRLNKAAVDSLVAGSLQ